MQFVRPLLDVSTGQTLPHEGIAEQGEIVEQNHTVSRGFGVEPADQVNEDVHEKESRNCKYVLSFDIFTGGVEFYSHNKGR